MTPFPPDPLLVFVKGKLSFQITKSRENADVYPPFSCQKDTMIGPHTRASLLPIPY